MALADRLTRAAAADGAELIVLPEKWTAMGSERGPEGGCPTLEGGPAVEWARALARELGVEMVAGSILEQVPGQEKLSNTSVHLDRDGEIRAIYRKVHMFDVEVGGRVYRESELEQAGREIVVSATAEGVELGIVDLLRPALPGAVPDTGRARREDRHRAGRLHPRDDPRPLGDAASGLGRSRTRSS